MRRLTSKRRSPLCRAVSQITHKMLKLSTYYGTLHRMKFLIVVSKKASALPALDNIKSVSIYVGVYLNVKMVKMTGVVLAISTLQAERETKNDENLGLRNRFASIPAIGTTKNSIGRSIKRSSITEYEEIKSNPHSRHMHAVHKNPRPQLCEASCPNRSPFNHLRLHS